jgi:uncharacterized BrkB/YihY/UPF0761 family membrane protein
VLGGGIALLVWLYWTAFLILLGAELNSEIVKLRMNPELTLESPAKSSGRSRAVTNAN